MRYIKHRSQGDIEDDTATVSGDYGDYSDDADYEAPADESDDADTCINRDGRKRV